jgi:hypothetical protein
LSINLSNGIGSVLLIIEVNKSETWGVLGNPDVGKTTILGEKALEVFLLDVFTNTAHEDAVLVLNGLALFVRHFSRKNLQLMEQSYNTT